MLVDPRHYNKEGKDSLRPDCETRREKAVLPATSEGSFADPPCVPSRTSLLSQRLVEATCLHPELGSSGAGSMGRDYGSQAPPG